MHKSAPVLWALQDPLILHPLGGPPPDQGCTGKPPPCVTYCVLLPQHSPLSSTEVSQEPEVCLWVPSVHTPALVDYRGKGGRAESPESL